jgi:lipopolysaccharide biosynthesis glycosyltransferase
VQQRQVYIGFDQRETLAWQVAQHSMLRHLTEAIPIHRLSLADLQHRKLYERPTKRVGNRIIDQLSVRSDYDGSISTEHANARFFVPELAHDGWALFTDGDVLVRADLKQMFDQATNDYAVMCVKHKHVPAGKTKMDGQKQTRYHRKNWSSVMLFNCDHPANKALTLDILNTWPGRDLHAMLWLEDKYIGALAPEWNYLVGYSKLTREPKLVHFTEGLPNMPGYDGCEYADEWWEAARLAAVGMDHDARYA